MSIIDSFDEKTEEVITPNRILTPIENFPETAILIFKERFFNYLVQNYLNRKIGFINAGIYIPIYEINYNNKKFAITRTTIGAPGTVATIEELISYGAKKILILGTCGTLDKNILKGHFVIPTEAYRDEGTSYHYASASDYIKIETANTLANIFDELHLKYFKGKTWTTDAFYRETKGNLAKRIAEGCITVDMEASAIAAVSQFRKLPIYQFFFSDDSLAGTEWDRRVIGDSEKERFENNIIDLSFKIAEKL